FGGSRWVRTWIGVRLATRLLEAFAKRRIISRPIRGEARMADQGDWRDKRRTEDMAAETEEPEAATRARAEDDAATRARQDETEAGLRAADRALEDGEARLRLTRSQLRQREQELERTSDLTREVAEGAADLRAQTSEIAEAARRRPGRNSGVTPPDNSTRENS